MKMNIKKAFLFLPVAACCAALFSACNENDKDYDNKVYINNTEKVGSILLKGEDEASFAIQTKMAKLESQAVQVTYKAAPELVDQYNAAFYDKAILMPDTCYEIPEPTVTITPGAVKANDVVVNFKNLTGLNRDLVYVLPVSISSSSIDVLQSASTIYYVDNGAALINVVANITKNYLSLDSPSAATKLGNMGQVTVEALVRVSKFGKLISTLMGIEGTFLIRIGDAGVPDNQLQLATSRGNVTDPTWQLSTGVWQHVAVTFDKSTGEVNVYLDGKKKATQKSSYTSNVNWNSSSFYIGKSYDDQRWLEGEISECRIWNRVLTADEINAPTHFYTVDPTSEGLVAYWKFDDGAGKAIKDYANGYGVTCNSDPTWKSVELP
jgi:hypothetical protein